MVLNPAAGISRRSDSSTSCASSVREMYTGQRPSGPGWNFGSTAAFARSLFERVRTAQVCWMYSRMDGRCVCAKSATATNKSKVEQAFWPAMPAFEPALPLKPHRLLLIAAPRWKLHMHAPVPHLRAFHTHMRPIDPHRQIITTPSQSFKRETLTPIRHLLIQRLQ